MIKSIKKKGKSRIEFLITLLCVGLGAILRLLYIIKYPVQVRDAYTYREIMEEWNNTGVIPDDAIVPPFALYISKKPAEWFGWETMQSGIIVNLLLGLLIIILLMKISKKIISSWIVMLCVGLIASTHPSLIEYSCNILRENTYLVLFCLGILEALKYWETSNAIHVLIMSLLAATAFLTRYEGLEFIFFFSCCIFMMKKKIIPRKRIRMFLLFIIMYVISFLSLAYTMIAPATLFSWYKKKFQSIHIERFFIQETDEFQNDSA
jgi:hypothetical protein